MSERRQRPPPFDRAKSLTYIDESKGAIVFNAVLLREAVNYIDLLTASFENRAKRPPAPPDGYDRTACEAVTAAYELGGEGDTYGGMLVASAVYEIRSLVAAFPRSRESTP